MAPLAHLLLAPLAAETWGGLRLEAGLGREALTALVAEQWRGGARLRGERRQRFSRYARHRSSSRRGAAAASMAAMNLSAVDQPWRRSTA